MIQEGRLSPEDAADLMDAFVDFEQERVAAPEGQPPSHEKTEPASGTAEGTEGAWDSDPFRKFVDNVDRLTREKLSAINWNEIAENIRDAARRGAESVRTSVEQISTGDVMGSWFCTDEYAECTLPLSTKSGDTLRLSIASGDVEVRGGTADPRLSAKVRVRARTREEAREKAANWTPVLEEHDGITTLRSGGDLASESYKIEVPEGVALEIQVKAGDVKVSGTAAGVRLTANAGDIDCEGIAGVVEIRSGSGDVRVVNSNSASIQIENQSGDVKLEKVSGLVRVRSASGDLDLRSVAGDNVSVETVNGDIDLSMANALDGQLNVRTVYGDVSVEILSGTNARVSLSSINGTVRCSTPLDDERKSDERMTGVLGTGVGTIDISAVSGDVSFGLHESN